MSARDCTAHVCASNASLRLYHIEWFISAAITSYIIILNISALLQPPAVDTESTFNVILLFNVCRSVLSKFRLSPTVASRYLSLYLSVMRVLFNLYNIVALFIESSRLGYFDRVVLEAVIKSLSLCTSG